MQRDVVHLNGLGLADALEPACPAEILAAQEGFRGGDHHSTTIRDPQPCIHRCMVRFHPTDIAREIRGVRWPQRQSLSHHVRIAVSFEQETVQFIRHLRCRDPQFFPGGVHQPVFDAAKQKHTGSDGDQVHQDYEVGQPAIPRRVEGLLKILLAHGCKISEHTKLSMRAAG